jgi:hypothetical protein
LTHHIRKGVTAFYIMFEDTPPFTVDAMRATAEDLGRAVGRPVLFRAAHREVDRDGEDNYVDLQTRQHAWTTEALARARADGVHWLIHIDDDELAVPRAPADTLVGVLDRVPATCASVHIPNWEAFSPAHPSADTSFFGDPRVQFLASGCNHLFAAYANGKAASRTLEGQAPHGPHHFRGGEECEIRDDDMIIAHFDSLALGPEDIPPVRWVEKNRLRVGGDLSKIPFSATLEGIAAVQSGDPRLLEEVWRKYRTVEGERFKKCPAPRRLNRGALCATGDGSECGVLDPSEGTVFSVLARLASK